MNVAITAPLAEPIRPAPLRLGRYSVHMPIANGGTACLHLGRVEGDAGFSRTVAVKRLHPELAQEPELVKMLIDEARLAARVQHVNVVQTLDVVLKDDEIFIVMDYLRGESLARLWRRMRDRGTRIPLEIACAIAVNALRGLHAAHEARDELGRPLAIVHRDVSPQNILVGTDGVARLIDFGVAKATSRLQTTREGTLKGKLAYMAPEQMSGGASRATDVWSAAVVLWECLTGQRLFYEESESKVFVRVLSQRVPPPTELVPSLPCALDGILLSALSRAPAARFATAGDMAAAIERVVPIARPAEVAHWLAEVAGDMLAARDALVASIERADGAPRAEEAKRISAIVPKDVADDDAEIPIVDEGLCVPDTERRPSIFAEDCARRPIPLPVTARRREHTFAAIVSLVAAMATFLGAVACIGSLVVRSHASATSSMPGSPRSSEVVAAKAVSVDTPASADVIERPAPIANAQPAQLPPPPAPIAAPAPDDAAPLF